MHLKSVFANITCERTNRLQRKYCTYTSAYSVALTVRENKCRESESDCGALEVPNDAGAVGTRADAAAVVARDADAVHGALALLHRLDQRRHELFP